MKPKIVQYMKISLVTELKHVTTAFVWLDIGGHTFNRPVFF